jgi:hypothetical protein
LPLQRQQPGIKDKKGLRLPGKHVTAESHQYETYDYAIFITNLLNDSPAKEAETGIGEEEYSVYQLCQKILPSGIKVMKIKCHLHLIFHGNVKISDEPENKEDRSHKGHSDAEIIVCISNNIFIMPILIFHNGLAGSEITV